VRAFEEISKDLNTALLDVYGKKQDKEKVDIAANEAINKANENRKNAASDLEAAQDKAVGYRREMEDLLNEVAPVTTDNRVRVSG